MRGTTVRSMPTIPPTKALMSTSRANCRQFSRSPSWTTLRRFSAARIDLADGSRLRQRRWHVGCHVCDKLGLIGDAQRFVVAFLKSYGRPGFAAEASATDGAGI